MKLSAWAKKQGITYKTAWNWFKTGRLPVHAFQTPTGTILVEEEQHKVSSQTWIYTRVSSPNKKDDLERQAQRIAEFCNARGWVIHKTVKEIASGMNDNRPKLHKMLEAKPSKIVVEHKDRLTRFGFKYIEVLLKQLGCEIVVIQRDVEEKDDLLKDLVSIVTSFCCRLYGLRRGQNKAKKLKDNLLS